MPLNNYIISAAIPSYWGWTAYTPVIPKLYWDVYSQEERIKRLCVDFDKLTHYASMIAEEVNNLNETLQETLTEFEEKINQQLEEQNENIANQLQEQNTKVNNELEKIRIYINQKFDDISEGQFVYDVTTGEYRPSYQTMRRLFQALSYDHKGDEQLVSWYADNKTVEELSQQSVYNTAYSNRNNVVIDDQIQ